MKRNSEYRARAKERLGGKIFNNAWLMPGVIMLIFSALTNFVRYTFITPEFRIVTVGSPFATVLIGGFLGVGLSGIFLRLCRGEENDVRIVRLFDGKDTIGTSLLLGLMQGLYVFLWSLLFIVPGICKAYSYAMAFNLQYDHPEYSWRQCLDESARLMKGHRMELFSLHLSYVGWFLLGVVTMGAGLFWVSPWIKCAETEFYLDLLEESTPDPAATGDPA